MVKKSSKNTGKEFVFTRKPIFNIHHQADPLFAAKCHPSEPIFITGTATGHVQTYRYDYEKLIEIYEDQDKFPYDISCVKYDDFDDNSIISQWHTKRHKKSCRDICFDLPSGGEKVHSIGSDGMIKTADIKTGLVTNKFNSKTDCKFDNNNYELSIFTKCLSVPNKNFLLVGDESGNLTCHDTRLKNLGLCYKPSKKLHMAEGINSINYCWPKSDYKIITTGSTNVCEIDLRKPSEPLHTSEDQEDEVLCATWLDQEKQETMICGMGDVVTTWKPQMNEWEDQISRIRVAKGETVESLVSAMDPDSRYVYGGCSNGHIAKIDIIGGKVVERFLQHDPEEDDKVDEVLGLDLDHQYRLVSFGTDGFKIWEDESMVQNRNEEEDDDDLDERSDSDDDGMNTDDYKNGSDSGDDSDSDVELKTDSKKNGSKKKAEDEDSEDEDEQDEDEDENREEDIEEEDDDRAMKATKRSLSESLKRRMEASKAAVSKKQKVETTQQESDVDTADSDIGEEVPDSDDETDFSQNKGKTVELHTIRDKIIAEIENPVDTIDNKGKKGKKKDKKPKKQDPGHGIRRFEGL